MIRNTLALAATLALTAAGTVAANAATFGNASQPNQSMIHQVHDGYGNHDHRWDGPPRWRPDWRPRNFVVPRCAMVRRECADYFRWGSFRWERCVIRRGC